MKYKIVKRMWLAAAVLTTTTSIWTRVDAMETPAVSGAGVIRALNEQRILSEQYALQPELAVAIAPNYVNIRKEPSIEAEVEGKLYRHTVGVVEAAEDGWYLITSGETRGYVNAEYVCTGEEAYALAETVGTHLARVTTTTLKVRTEPSLDAKVLGLVPEGDILTVAENSNGWLKVEVEEGEGYVAADYVETYTEYPHAESIREEQERLAREESAREEAARKAAAEAQEARQKEAEKRAAREEEQKAAAQKAAEQQKKDNQENTSGISLGQQIASYGLQFVGNPYVYGGTSLTNGADCSGFVQSVYKNFGISLPRTSGEQGTCGRAVATLQEAVPGDLIWYSGHIGIYIGNGQIVHASSAKTGIKVSRADYRTILSIRRIV